MDCPRCKLKVDEHPANRCMDAWVHVDVMGKEQLDRLVPVPQSVTTPHYSTEIAAAWGVVEKMNDMGYTVELRYDMVAWAVIFMHIDDAIRHTSDWRCSLTTQICRAALKASCDD